MVMLVVIAIVFIIIAIAQCKYLRLTCFLGYLFATSIDVLVVMSFSIYLFEVTFVTFLESFHNVMSRGCTALGTLLLLLIQRTVEMY